ncbi:hypothetical protein DITRI_Ditri03aG0097400 [Diplodiscus trichospermus]
MEYPSFVNASNSWRNNLSYDFSFWESVGVKAILVNGIVSPQVVWSANRSNPVENQAQLQLNPDGGLILKDGHGVVVWSANTVGKSISRLNLSAEGNLMLFNKTNNMGWQSFDYPTGSLVRGQRLESEQKLKENVSPFNSSEGLYAFAIIEYQLTAYVDIYPFQIYYSREIGNISGLSYDEYNVEFNVWELLRSRFINFYTMIKRIIS